MTAIVLSIASFARPARSATSWNEIVESSDSFLHYCLMLLQQLDCVRSGHIVDVPNRMYKASIDHVQNSLRERGYQTTFEEGGSKGFGYITFN